MVVKDKIYAKVDSPWMQLVVRFRLGALAVHWIFQGMLYMDPTERNFKLGMDFLLFLIFGAFLELWINPILAFGLGAIMAHTLNLVFNGQIYGVLKHFGNVRHSWLEFNREVERLQMKVSEEPFIAYAAAYGSLARDEWSSTSDLDVRLVRQPGLHSAWRVCWFAVRERTRAFWIKFPLDIYVLDNYESLDKISEKNTPIVLISSGPSDE